MANDHDWKSAAAVFGMSPDEAGRQTLPSLSRRAKRLQKDSPSLGGDTDPTAQIEQAYDALRDWIKAGKPGLTDEGTAQDRTKDAPPQPDPPSLQPGSATFPLSTPLSLEPPIRPLPPVLQPLPRQSPAPRTKAARPAMPDQFYERRTFRIAVAIVIVLAVTVHRFKDFDLLIPPSALAWIEQGRR